MKKILLVSSEFPPLPGGIGNHAINLATGLILEGNSIEVITNQRSRVLFDDLSFDNTLIFRVTRIKRRKIIITTYLERVLQCVRKTNELKADVVIASGKFSLWTVAVLKFLFSTPKYFAILHGSELRAGGSLSQLITRWALKRFDHIVAVSNFTKQLAFTINDQLPITVINNGFSPIQLTSIPYSKHKNISIITVGNVTFRKGQQNVIRSLPMLREHYPNIHYHVVGIPSKVEAFKALADEYNVTNNVTFHGALTNAQLTDILLQCHIFFMLSDNLLDGDVEGFGIAVLEANYYGLPAIGSINSGIADAIKDYYSGRLVDPHDTRQILAALIEILDNYAVYATRAKEWSTHFHWDTIVKNYVRVLEQPPK